MSADPFEIPAFLRVDAAEQARRRLAGRGLRLRWTREMNFDDPADRPDKDPGTARLLDERRALERATAKAEKARRKKDRLIRERQRANPPGHEPTDQETNVKTKTKKLPNTHPAVRGRKKARKTDRRQNPSARTAHRAIRAANKKTPSVPSGDKPDVVRQIADLMARPIGHKDAPLGGASMEELVKATGYLPHPMRAKIKLVRDRLKYTTTAPSKENGRRYFAEPPKAEG